MSRFALYQTINERRPSVQHHSFIRRLILHLPACYCYTRNSFHGHLWVSLCPSLRISGLRQLILFAQERERVALKALRILMVILNRLLTTFLWGISPATVLKDACACSTKLRMKGLVWVTSGCGKRGAKIRAFQ
jgi:hypothetical protein